MTDSCSSHSDSLISLSYSMPKPLVWIHSDFFFQCCAPILKPLTLENCQDECDSHSQCYSWSYHLTSKKCYLKNEENYQNFVLKERYTKQDEYISGVKHCDPMEEEISRNNNNLRVFIHGHQLKALYANFGRQIHPGIKVSMNFFCGLIQREICI